MDPFAPEAIRATTAAAQAGDGAAAHLLAVLDASGRMGKPHWPRVLGFLQRAAELGFPLAQAQLALLAGEDADGTARQWERLRERVDVAAWLAVPPARAAHDNPRIGIVETFASPALCRWLIARGRPYLKPAQIDDLSSGRPAYDSARTNSTADLALTEMDVVMHLLRARMLALAGPAAIAMEGSAILHYQPGQQFLPHYDFLDPSVPGFTEQVAQFGQRVLTILIYLNDGYDGGETEFPVLGWRYKGRTGDALLFWNVDAAGRPDRLTLHAGTAPISGEKWLLSQWVRGRGRA